MKTIRFIQFALFFALFACATVSFGKAKPYQPLQFQTQGVSNPLANKNILAALENLRAQFTFPITQQDMNDFIKKAPKVIERAIKPYGYFHARVAINVSHQGRSERITFTIQEGAPMKISHVVIQITGAGKEDHRFLKLLKKIPFHSGDILQTPQYDDFKSKLYNLATQRGYFKAKMIQSQIRIRKAQNQAEIIIIFDTGPRYRFGETTFSKNPFHQAFLEKFLQYQKGHHYNAKKLERTQEGLVRSAYFDQVIIKPYPKEAVNDEVPIKIKLITKKAKEYIAGIGYGTDTGIRGTLGWTLRHIGGNGHRFHMLLRASQYNSSFTTKYIIPGPNPAADSLSIGAGVSNMEQSTGNAKNAKLGVTYSIAHQNWNNAFTLAYLTERYNINSLPNTSTELVYPTFETTYRNIDHPLHPTKGFSFTTKLTGASESVLSQTDFFQITSTIKTLFTIKKTHTRLLLRGSAGRTDIANLVRLPLSLQLFAGGAESMRGYGYNSIGPGRNLAVASGEVQQRVFGDWYLAGFIDAGVVGNQNLFQHINADAGPGIVWITDIGALELTYANAYTQSNHPWTIQFTMGSQI